MSFTVDNKITDQNLDLQSVGWILAASWYALLAERLEVTSTCYFSTGLRWLGAPDRMFPESLGFISCLHLGNRDCKKEASSVFFWLQQSVSRCSCQSLLLETWSDFSLPVCLLVWQEPAVSSDGAQRSLKSCRSCSGNKRNMSSQEKSLQHHSFFLFILMKKYYPGLIKPWLLQHPCSS